MGYKFQDLVNTKKLFAHIRFLTRSYEFTEAVYGIWGDFDEV